MITPYMATASQKIILIKFLDFILGALTAAPSRVEPVIKIPQAAPTIENPKAKPRPI
jgi:hypothetical protein